jgi:VWFA-related protein
VLSLIVAASIAFPGGGAFAQQQSQPKPQDPAKIISKVDLVVLHASVLDERGKMVNDLKIENFRVFEDRIEQKLDYFRREDVPVSMGLVIDNSGSMREKRDRVNVAALTFVKTSNPQDEVFVVNFNDEYYLDLDKDFTSDINELKEALERVDSRGSTAMYDALVGSLDHVKKGRHDKKVLLLISDGVDNASRIGRGDSERGMQLTLLEAQKSEAVIYTVGLFSDDMKKSEKRKMRANLTALSQATGGLAYFPETTAEVEPVCTQIAHDIRNQYTLAYTSSNSARDGSFRTVQVQVIPPRGRGKFNVRTRSGYYATREATSGGN